MHEGMVIAVCKPKGLKSCSCLNTATYIVYVYDNNFLDFTATTFTHRYMYICICTWQPEIVQTNKPASHQFITYLYEVYSMTVRSKI